ncbi:IS3 family transposase [Gemmatimonadota bacterium]
MLRKRSGLMYPFIAKYTGIWTVTTMCRALGVSRSGHYDRLGQGDSDRERANRRLLTEIRAIFEVNKMRYGSPRVWLELQAQGMKCGVHRVARLMRKADLKARRPKRYRPPGSPKHDFPVVPNILERRFSAEHPDTHWVADITYIPVAEGWLNLAAIMDLFSRRIVGWSLRPGMDRQLTLDALIQAIHRREPRSGTIHHSTKVVSTLATITNPC